MSKSDLVSDLTSECQSLLTWTIVYHSLLVSMLWSDLVFA